MQTRIRSQSISEESEDVAESKSPGGKLAFFLYLVLSANDGIMKAKSKRQMDGPDAPSDFPYAFSSVMLMSCIVSAFVGNIAAFWCEGPAGVKRCWNFQSIKQTAPINALFQFATVLKFASLRLLDPDVVSLLSQLNLVFLALVGQLALGRRYNCKQWAALGVITLCIWLYLASRGDNRKYRDTFFLLSPSLAPGYFMILLMCCVETYATVLAEKYFKGCEQTLLVPFWVQKVHVDVSGMVFAIIWAYFMEPVVLKDYDLVCKPQRCRQVIEHGLFSGWDRWTLVVLMVVVGKAWLAGLVAKLLDSVMKQIGSCLAIFLTYLELILWLEPSQPSLITLACLAAVLGATFKFVEAGNQKSAQNHDAWVQNYPGQRLDDIKG